MRLRDEINGERERERERERGLRELKRQHIASVPNRAKQRHNKASVQKKTNLSELLKTPCPMWRGLIRGLSKSYWSWRSGIKNRMKILFTVILFSEI